MGKHVNEALQYLRYL